MSANMRLTWIEADGTSTDLTADNGVAVLRGLAGLDVADRALTADDLVSTDGALLASARFNRRHLLLPLMLRSQGTRVLDVIGTAARMFQGPGVLRYTDDYNTRELHDIYYEAGLEGNQSSDVAITDRWRKVVVSLVAMNPWWHGESKVVHLGLDDTAAFDDAAIDFDDPDTYFDGGDSTGVVVDGDVAALPLIVFVGPMDAGATVTLAGGGGSIQITIDLLTDNYITVDTQPGNRGPRFNGGAIDWSLISSDSRLFELAPGTSTLSAQVDGADVNSFIEVTYAERWLTA